MLRTAALLLVLGLVSGCGPREPVRVGFLGGLSGRVADLGEAGRNGAQIAVEEVNRAGGIDGRQIQLIVRDDCLLYTSPSPRDRTRSRMPSSA